MNNTAGIRFEGVTKYYGKNIGIQDVSFTVPHGKITGMIGKNGAGKTTSLKVLTGLIPKYTGAVSDSREHQEDVNILQKSVGFSPEKLELYGLQTVWEFLTTLSRIRGIKSTVYKPYIQAVLSLFEIEAYRNTYVTALSKGTLQKLAFIQTFLHTPKIAILDEPTSGIDPVAKKKMFDFLAQYRDQGNTVIVSSHRLDELERLCDYVIILDNGLLLCAEPMQAILAEKGSLESYFISCVETEGSL